MCIERRYSEEYDDDGGGRKKEKKDIGKTENIKPVQWGRVTTLSQKTKFDSRNNASKLHDDDISSLVGWLVISMEISMHTSSLIQEKQEKLDYKMIMIMIDQSSKNKIDQKFI